MLVTAFSKRPDSVYRSRRLLTARLKTKCYEISEFEVAGVLRERGKPAVALMATTAGTGATSAAPS